MGQKVHPYGFRLGFNKPWRSRWFANHTYATLLQEDLELKENLRDRLKSAGVSSIEVDRPGNKLRVTIRTSRPGIIIGRKGAEIEKLKQDMAKKTKREVFIDIQEVHKPELDAHLDSLAAETQRRIDGLAHGAPECHALFQLQRDRLRNQLGIQLWLVTVSYTHLTLPTNREV